MHDLSVLDDAGWFASARSSRGRLRPRHAIPPICMSWRRLTVGCEAGVIISRPSYLISIDLQRHAEPRKGTDYASPGRLRRSARLKIVRESAELGIARRHDRMGDRPGDRESGVRPEQAAFATRLVRGIDLVEQVRGFVTQDAEAVRKSGGDPHRQAVLV